MYGALQKEGGPEAEEPAPGAAARAALLQRRTEVGFLAFLGSLALFCLGSAGLGPGARSLPLTQLVAEAPATNKVQFVNSAFQDSCASYDDDAFDAECPAMDERAFCDQGIMRPGSPLETLCPGACADSETAWTMVCAWEAIKSLPQACAGTFEAAIAGVPKAERAQGPEPSAGEAAKTLGGKAELFECDAHAVCFACYNPFNEGGTADARFCEAVADYYGGFGAPYYPADSVLNGGQIVTQNYPMYLIDGQHLVGASPAIHAINEDWDFWCNPETIAAIQDGSFRASYRGAQAQETAARRRR